MAVGKELDEEIDRTGPMFHSSTPKMHSSKNKSHGVILAPRLAVLWIPVECCGGVFLTGMIVPLVERPAAGLRMEGCGWTTIRRF